MANPGGSSGLSVVGFFSEKLKTSNVVLVPPSFELSGDPNKLLGEEAEKKVIESFDKCGRDIPGIQTICFHGVRVIGGNPSIIREVDQCCFLTYQGRRYILITEVKCNADIKKSGTWDESVFLAKKNPPSLPSSFLVWERCQVSPKKISKSGHWGILRKRTFCT